MCLSHSIPLDRFQYYHSISVVSDHALTFRLWRHTGSSIALSLFYVLRISTEQSTPRSMKLITAPSCSHTRTETTKTQLRRRLQFDKELNTQRKVRRSHLCSAANMYSSLCHNYLYLSQWNQEFQFHNPLYRKHCDRGFVAQLNGILLN